MRNKILLASPHMGNAEFQYIKEAFEMNWIAPLGPNVDAFEKEIADYVKGKAATATSSGTAAIHLALKVIGVQEGDYVLCSSLTFAASCNPIIYEKAIPVFIDSEPDTWNMSPIALKKAIKDLKRRGIQAKAAIVVNLYGQSAQYDEIITLCKEAGIIVIEDAAESLGATYQGQATGTIGDLGIYSFNGNKIITTSGGGMLVSNNEEWIKKAEFLATQARENKRYYHHKEIGFNYRMSNISAGIGRGQLQVLDDRIKRKRQIYLVYEQGFQSISSIKMQPISSKGNSNYWLSCITLQDTSVTPLDIIIELEKHHIEARHIWKPMHLQPIFEDCLFYSHLDDGSICERLFYEGVCLPSDTKMTEEEQQYVINVIKGLF